MELRPVRLGKRHEGDDVGFGLVHQLRQLADAGPQLVGDLAPGLRRSSLVGLHEHRPDGGGHHLMLGLRHVGQGIPHEMNTTSLPRCSEDLSDGGLQTFVGVRDDEPDALQPAFLQPAQEPEPEHGGLRRAEAEAQDLAPAVGVDARGDDRRHRHDAPVLAHLQVGRVEPQVGPLPLDRPLQKGIHPDIDALAQLRYLALRDPAHPHRLHEIVHLAGRHALDPGLLDHRHQGLFGRPARLKETGEVRTLPQLRDLQIQRPQPRVEGTVAIPVALRGALLAPLVAARADLPFHVVGHQPPQHLLGQILHEVAPAALQKRVQQWHGVVGHRALRFVSRVSNPTLPRGTVITQEGGGLRHVRSSAHRPRLQIHTTSVDATNPRRRGCGRPRFSPVVLAPRRLSAACLRERSITGSEPDIRH